MSAHLQQIESAAPGVGLPEPEPRRETPGGDHRWAEAVLTGENRVLEMIAKGDPLAPILDAICLFGEEICGSVLVSILLLSPDGKSLRHGAAPSLPKGYTAAIDGAPIGPRAGSCGTAAYTRKPVIVSDIARDPLWDQYRHLAMSHGLRACWSTPILSSDQDVLGTFAIYWREPRSPTEQHHKIIEQITHLAAIAIERKRAEQELRRSEAYLAEAQRLSLTGSFGWNASTGEISWSKETFCIMGYDPARKPTLELVLERVHPEDVRLVQQTIDRATRNGTAFDFEHRLLMPNGSIKHVQVVARPSKTEAGEVEFVGAVMDITERKRAAEALRASEHLARGQVETLTRTLTALAQESEPEKFLEHVLEMIGRELESHSLSVYEMNPNTGQVQPVATYEEGRLHLAPETEVQSSPHLDLTTQYHPIWTEFFRTGAHCVIGNIQSDTVRVRIAEIPDSPWYDWTSDIVVSPASQAIVQRLHSIGIVATLAVPTFVAGKVTGLISIRFKRKRLFRPEEIELTRALTHQAMLAIRLIRLSHQSRQSAVMAERNRMARDIHDTLAQGFTGVIVQLEAAADATSRGLAKEAEKHLNRAAELARESLKEARRSVRALRPHALEEKNLCQALEDLARKMTAGTTMQAEFDLRGAPRPLPAEWEENLLHIGQEVLTNALRHAQASEFKTQLVFHPQEIRLELRDNGRGFDPARKREGLGLLGMSERVEGMGGRLSIQSANGKGTAILIALPLAATDHALEP